MALVVDTVCGWHPGTAGTLTGAELTAYYHTCAAVVHARTENRLPTGFLSPERQREDGTAQFNAKVAALMERTGKKKLTLNEVVRSTI